MPRAESADPGLLSTGAQVGPDAASWPLALASGYNFLSVERKSKLAQTHFLGSFMAWQAFLA